LWPEVKDGALSTLIQPDAIFAVKSQQATAASPQQPAIQIEKRGGGKAVRFITDRIR